MARRVRCSRFSATRYSATPRSREHLSHRVIRMDDHSYIVLHLQCYFGPATTGYSFKRSFFGNNENLYRLCVNSASCRFYACYRARCHCRLGGRQWAHLFRRSSLHYISLSDIGNHLSPCVNSGHISDDGSGHLLLACCLGRAPVIRVILTCKKGPAISTVSLYIHNYRTPWLRRTFCFSFTISGISEQPLILECITWTLGGNTVEKSFIVGSHNDSVSTIQ